MLSFTLKVKEKLSRYQITVAVIMIATVIIGSGLTLAQASANEAGQGQMLLAQYGLDEAAPEVLKKSDTLGTQIGKIINSVLGLIGVVMFVLLIFAGWTWMTAGGNEEKVRMAQKVLENAILGLIITALAFTITNFWFGRMFQ